MGRILRSTQADQTPLVSCFICSVCVTEDGWFFGAGGESLSLLALCAAELAEQTIELLRRVEAALRSHLPALVLGVLTFPVKHKLWTSVCRTCRGDCRAVPLEIRKLDGQEEEENYRPNETAEEKVGNERTKDTEEKMEEETTDLLRSFLSTAHHAIRHSVLPLATFFDSEKVGPSTFFILASFSSQGHCTLRSSSHLLFSSPISFETSSPEEDRKQEAETETKEERPVKGRRNRFSYPKTGTD